MLNHTPNSLESLDWDRVDAFSYKNTRLISVPLNGPEELLAVNRVVFYSEQDEVHTTEIYTTIKDAHNVNVKSLAGKKLIHDKNIELPSEPEAQNTTGFTLDDLDRNKLNDCLGRLHINTRVVNTIAVVWQYSMRHHTWWRMCILLLDLQPESGPQILSHVSIAHGHKNHSNTRHTVLTLVSLALLARRSLATQLLGLPWARACIHPLH